MSHLRPGLRKCEARKCEKSIALAKTPTPLQSSHLRWKVCKYEHWLDRKCDPMIANVKNLPPQLPSQMRTLAFRKCDLMIANANLGWPRHTSQIRRNGSQMRAWEKMEMYANANSDLANARSEASSHKLQTPANVLSPIHSVAYPKLTWAPRALNQLCTQV